MTPEKQRAIWIVYQLRKRGTSAAEVARRLGKSKGNISDVLIGRVKTKVIREEIARVLGMPVEKIWKDKEKGA